MHTKPHSVHCYKDEPFIYVILQENNRLLFWESQETHGNNTRKNVEFLMLNLAVHVAIPV
jgi:hypothetical protein